MWPNPCQVESDEEPQEVNAAVLLPHELFHALFEAGQGQASLILRSFSTLNSISKFS